MAGCIPSPRRGTSGAPNRRGAADARPVLFNPDWLRQRQLEPFRESERRLDPSYAGMA